MVFLEAYPEIIFSPLRVEKKVSGIQA